MESKECRWPERIAKIEIRAKSTAVDFALAKGVLAAKNNPCKGLAGGVVRRLFQLLVDWCCEPEVIILIRQWNVFPALWVVQKLKIVFWIFFCVNAF